MNNNQIQKAITHIQTNRNYSDNITYRLMVELLEVMLETEEKKTDDIQIVIDGDKEQYCDKKDFPSVEEINQIVSDCIILEKKGLDELGKVLHERLK